MRVPSMPLLARLRANISGTTVVEFAFALPVLLAMYLGGYVLADESSASRKVTSTARAITDLTTRYGALTTTQLNTIMAASAQILVPYNGANAKQRVSEVLVTGATTATVVWSQVPTGQTGMTALPACTVVTLNANMAATGSYVILGEVGYAYTPLVGLGSGHNTNFYDRYFMIPRLVSAIAPPDGSTPTTCPATSS